VLLLLYHSDSKRTFVECIAIASAHFVLYHMNDPLAFGFQAPDTSRTRPYRTLYSAEPICEFRLAKAGRHRIPTFTPGISKGTSKSRANLTREG
jgi:hypothetical protein